MSYKVEVIRSLEFGSVKTFIRTKDNLYSSLVTR